jgi:hypothetical protein
MPTIGRMAPDTPDPHVLAPGTAPTPFTADQIRAACPSGRTAVFAVTGAAGAVSHRMSRFVDSDDDGTTFERGACTPDGQPVDGLEGRRMTWLDLQRHASFPAAAVTIDEDTLDLPVGRLDCLRYVVTDDEDVTTFWFATSIPGMPVKVVGAMAGHVVETSEMVAHLLP